MPGTKHRHALEEENEILQNELIEQKHKLARAKLQLRLASSKPNKYNLDKAEIQTLVEQVLDPHFSKPQIKAYVRGTWRQVKEWEDRDILLGLTLHMLGPRVYRYLRRKQVLPLPGETTLRRHFKDFQIR